MENQNGEPRFLEKISKQVKISPTRTASLRDIPLEVRRKDARKPLFLVRYE